jgi:hypothetical protein
MEAASAAFFFCAFLGPNTHERCTKDARTDHRPEACGMAEYAARGGALMNKLIARLIKCGMPRDVALAVCRSFKRDSNMFEFERYVEGVEEECREQMEAVPE